VVSEERSMNMQTLRAAQQLGGYTGTLADHYDTAGNHGACHVPGNKKEKKIKIKRKINKKKPRRMPCTQHC
jgi:hypothetical protein